MFKVKISDSCPSEQRYILDILLGEFLGISFEVEIHDDIYTEITLPGKSGKLTLDSSFFYQAKNCWLTRSSLPNLPLKIWKPANNMIEPNLVKHEIPVLFGEPGLHKKDNQIHINLDIFGSAFFMLSRYEEFVKTDRDNHSRFPATASIAYKEGFLDRPIINEYLEILRYCLSEIWPKISFKKRSGNNFITCDVDWPFEPALYSVKHSLKKIARLLIKEKNFKKAFFTGISFFAKRLGLTVEDNYRNAISWMMDVNEKAGNQIAFYFITHNTSSLDTLDDKDFDTLRMRSLLNEISTRGHEIGVHPGYETFKNIKTLKKTVDNLKTILKEEKIDQKVIGGRQHFLRWDVKHTPHIWDKVGLVYDTSLSFADKAGFRCGICYEFSMYDIKNRRKLLLKQKPLIIMECSIIASRYEGMGYSEESLKRFIYFKEVTRKFNGTFTLLWHNSHFENERDKYFYKSLIR